MNSTTNDSNDVYRQCRDLIEHLDEILGLYEPLSPAEVRRMPRLQRRRESVVDELLALCRHAGIDGGGVGSLQEMTAARDEVAATRRLLAQLEHVRARLDAKRMLAEARTMRQLSFFYELVRRAAVFDEAIRARFAPILALSMRPRRARARDCGAT